MDFNIIWNRYEKELTAFVNSQVYDKNQVKDIMQEVAIKIYKNNSLLRDIENIRAWLYRLTRNTLIDFYRQYKKTIPEELYNIDTFYDKEKIEENQLLDCINQLSNNLKSSDKKILDLSIHKEYSLKEISLEFDLSIDGAKSKLKRAKNKLAKEFFSCCSLEKDSQNKIIDFKCLGECDC